MAKSNRAKNELLKIKLIDTQIKTIREEIQYQYDRATKITASIGGCGGGGTSRKDKIGDAVADKSQLEDELLVKEAELKAMREKWLPMIMTLQDYRQIKVIYRKYFDFKSLDDISAEIGYSRRHIDNFHGKALQALNEMIDKED